MRINKLRGGEEWVWNKLRVYYHHERIIKDAVPGRFWMQEVAVSKEKCEYESRYKSVLQTNKSSIIVPNLVSQKQGNSNMKNMRVCLQMKAH